MERHTESTQHLLSLEVSRLHPLIKASHDFLSSSGESSFQLHRLLWNRNQCECTTQLFLFRTCFQRKRNRVPGRRLLRQVQGSMLHNSHSSGTTQVCAGWQVDKENTVFANNGLSLSLTKRAVLPSATEWVDPRGLRPREMSQVERQTPTCVLLKKGSQTRRSGE